MKATVFDRLLLRVVCWYIRRRVNDILSRSGGRKVMKIEWKVIGLEFDLQFKPKGNSDEGATVKLKVDENSGSNEFHDDEFKQAVDAGTAQVEKYYDGFIAPLLGIAKESVGTLINLEVQKHAQMDRDYELRSKEYDLRAKEHELEMEKLKAARR